VNIPSIHLDIGESLLILLQAQKFGRGRSNAQKYAFLRSSLFLFVSEGLWVFATFQSSGLPGPRPSIKSPKLERVGYTSHGYQSIPL
jgi:hypothetical protein